MSRHLRRLLLFIAFLFLLWTLFEGASAWSVGGFLLCGGAWYGLTILKTRELDSPRPR